MSLKLNHFYEFGPFRLDAVEQLLLRQGEVVPLSPKALDLLVVLVENSGRVLSKDELMRRVWQGTFVEEANLSHHVFTLRKALGEDRNGTRFIETIPRRGYRFVAQVTEVRDEPDVVFVEEHSRSRIIIEEETEKSDDKRVVLAPAEQSQSQEIGQIQQGGALETSRPGLLRRSRRLIALATAAVVLAGGAIYSGYLSGRAPFRGGQAGSAESRGAEVGSKIRLTRLTDFGKCISNISPDGKFICYVQNTYEGVGALWVRQVATNKDHQLIEPGERVFNGTAFSPDGQFIYYSMIAQHEPDGALYRVPVLGGPPTRLIGHCGSMFTLSPDGTRAAFFRYFGDTKLWSIVIAALHGNDDGSDEQTLLTIRYPQQTFFGTPCWSPDSQQIAYGVTVESGGQDANGNISVFAVDLDSRQVRPLTTEMWTQMGRMAWSADGKNLILVGTRPRLGNQLYSLDPATGVVRQLTSGLQGYGNYGLGITADGDTLVADGWESSSQIWITGTDGRASSAARLTTGVDDGAEGLAFLSGGRVAYVSRTGDDLDLWTMKVDGTDAKPFTADAFAERDVAARADGRYLVFASNRGGGSHIFRVDADGANVKQLTFGDGYDATPDCSPDGEWVVYASRLGDKSTIWKVPIDGGAPVQLTDYHSITPSFSPDGKLLSCILPNMSKVQRGSLAIFPADGGAPIKIFRVVQFGWSYVTPRWAPDQKAIVYTEKQHSVGNLWRQPLAGGVPEQLTDFKTDFIFNFAFSRDGKSLALARGPNGAYAVLIKDFR